jgi:hypothetical protein
MQKEEKAPNRAVEALGRTRAIYYFPTTGVLSSGFNYTIAVTGLPSGFTTSTPASQAFPWQGTALAFGFALN